MQTNPAHTDGRSAILDPLVECLNLTGDGTTYQRYGYLSDSIDPEAVQKEHADSDGSPLGSDTRQGFEKGPLSITCSKASHKLPQPGHIIHCDFGEGDEYFVAGKPGRQRERNNVKKAQFQVAKCYNPIITSLLTEAYGSRKTATQVAGALSMANTVVNTRTGGTGVWSLAAAPGYTVPAWLTISSTTGALSGTAVAGSFELYIIYTETVTGEESRSGFGQLSLTVTAAP
jgi:hypothetical protein